MSRFVGDQLNDALLSRLSLETAIEHSHRALVIATIDEHGWPHPAMVSSLELVARDSRNIRLALHTRSRSLRNVCENGRLTVIVADEQGVHYIKGDALVVSPALASRTELAGVNLRVDSVLEDVAADYEHARLTTGIRVERDAIDRAACGRLLQELVADSTP
jgi:pyridoxamine 5'-phosphate oxidase-like protein